MRGATWVMLLLAAGGCASLRGLFAPAPPDPETAALIRGLAQEQRVASQRPGSQYALSCPSIATLVSKGRPAVRPLRRALDDGNPVVRRNAAIALARLHDPAARAPLIDLLADDRRSVLEHIAVLDCLHDLPGAARDTALVAAARQAVEANAALSAVAADELGRMGNPAAAPLLVDMLARQVAEPAARTAAARALGQLGLAQAPSALLAAATDGSAAVREAVAQALAAIGDRDAAPAAVALLSDESFPVQEAALRAVARIGGVEAVGRVLLFLDHPRASMREEAVRTLEALGSVIGLEHALLNDQWRVRRQAAEALGRIGSDASLKALRRAVDDQALPVRQAAAAALADSRRFAAAPLLLMLLDDGSLGVRERAHGGLCAIAGHAEPYDPGAPPAKRREGLQAWERWWLTVNPATLSTPEALALRERETNERIALAVKDLSSADPTVRRAAEERLKNLGPASVPALESLFDPQTESFPPGVAERLLPAVSEVYRHVQSLRTARETDRRDAALALSRLEQAGRVSETAAVLLVRIAEREDDAFVRRFLIDILGAHPGAGATRVLVARLDSPDAWERMTSARLLGQRRDRAAVVPLIAALGDRSTQVRIAATWALGRIGDGVAVAPLLDVLRTAAVDLRLEAAAALAGFRRREGVDELLRNLANPDPRWRQLACEKVGEARVWEALPQLSGLLTDDRRPVRDAAASALRAITGQDLGYYPADPPDQRDAAVRRWQEYIRQHRPAP
jgi:HEAT repeat protein